MIIGNVKFKEWLCTVDVQFYNNGRFAICLDDKETGEPVAVASVNMPKAILKADEVCIKNYSENEGILKSLVDSGFIEETGNEFDNGYVVVPICRLTKESLIIINK